MSETQYFTADDGARIAFLDEGEGVPVLALSGLTRNVHDFDYVAPHLSGVRFIRMDYRGRGASQFTGAETYTVPREALDAVQLLDHLGLKSAAILGTSRGGLIGLVMAATVKDRMLGLCLNDVGPELEARGLEIIFDYIGRNPAAQTYDELAAKLPFIMKGFDGVSAERWGQEVRHHYVETPSGLKINYDPALRDAFLEAFKGESPDLWPLFDACAGLPLCLIRGANSELLGHAAAERMRTARPDMVFTEVADRGHIPFLDEPEALAAIRAWLGQIGG